MADVTVVQSAHGKVFLTEQVELPLCVPRCEWDAVDARAGFVAVAASVVEYNGQRARVYLWDVTKDEVEEKDGWALWDCRDGEEIRMLRVSPKGGAVALVTSTSRVVVHSTGKVSNIRVKALTVQHTSHKAPITSICWGYKGVYTSDEQGVIYEYDWLSAFRPTRLADIGERILHIAANTFTVSSHVHPEEKAHLLVTTERRCLLLNTLDGMIITVGHSGVGGRGLAGAAFHAATGGIVLLNNDGDKATLSLKSPPVNTVLNGIETLHEVSLLALSNLNSAPLTTLSTMRDGNVLSASAASCHILNPYVGVVSEYHFSAPIRQVAASSTEVFCLLANNDIIRLHNTRPIRIAPFTPGRRRRPIEQIAVHTAAAASLSILTATAVRRLKRRKTEEPIAPPTPPRPQRILSAEELERASQLTQQVSATVIEGLRSTYQLLNGVTLGNGKPPHVPYLLRVVLSAGVATAAVGSVHSEEQYIRASIRAIVTDIVSGILEEEYEEGPCAPTPIPPARTSSSSVATPTSDNPSSPRQADRKPRKKQLKILRTSTKSKAAVIKSPARKAVLTETNQLNFNDIELLRSPTVSPYSVEIRKIVDEETRVQSERYATKMQELLVRHTASTAIVGTMCVVLATWDRNILQVRRDATIELARVAALATAVIGWDEITVRLQRKAVYRLCRDMVQNVWWAVEDEIVLLEKRKARKAEEDRLAAQLAILQDIQSRQTPVSHFRRTNEEDIMKNFDALNLLIHTKCAVFTAALCIITHPCMIVAQRQETDKVKEGIAVAMVKWAVELIRGSDADSSHGEKDSVLWEALLPEEVTEQVATLREGVRNEILNACKPLIEKHQQEVADLGPTNGKAVTYEYERTPLWRAEWSKALLLSTDPPAWCGTDGKAVAYNPVRDPDVLPRPSFVWDDVWQTTDWEYSNGSYWEQACGMFSILRRRRWSRAWVCPRTTELRAQLLATQTTELKDWTRCVITDILEREYPQ
eukprot:TRINITY_DN4366_c1_g1_i2.p1 TRINITY_DN4366_c1_g1~~TRINITY_DN4366_c1_g1_i2.p1  ORF type:complete len:994 (+),score=286.00 TRINITY_DN4366_c1_g1_i2:27-2984(+)